MKRSAVCTEMAESGAANEDGLRRLGRGVMQRLDSSDSSVVLSMRAAVVAKLLISSIPSLAESAASRLQAGCGAQVRKLSAVTSARRCLSQR